MGRDAKPTPKAKEAMEAEKVRIQKAQNNRDKKKVKKKAALMRYREFIKSPSPSPSQQQQSSSLAALQRKLDEQAARQLQQQQALDAAQALLDTKLDSDMQPEDDTSIESPPTKPRTATKNKIPPAREPDDDEEGDVDEEKSNKQRRTDQDGTGMMSDTCRHCLTGLGPGFCTNLECGLRVDQDYGTAQNVDIREQRRKGKLPTMTTPTYRNELTIRDKEYLRIMAAAKKFTRYSDRLPCSVATAIDIVQGAYRGAKYEPATDTILTLLQSGACDRIGDCVPRVSSITWDNVYDDPTTTAVVISGDGAKFQQGSTKAYPLPSLAAFMRALLHTIIPSLILQPVVLMDWVALAITLTEITEERDWDTAKEFLDQHLPRSITKQKPVGEQHSRILEDIYLARTLATTAPIQSQQQAQQQPARQQQQAQQRTRQQSPAPGRGNACRSWNHGNCTRADCKNTHECMIARCSGANRNHRMIECPEFEAGKNSSHRPVKSSRPAMNVVKAEGRVAADVAAPARK